MVEPNSIREIRSLLYDILIIREPMDLQAQQNLNIAPSQLKGGDVKVFMMQSQIGQIVNEKIVGALRKLDEMDSEGLLEATNVIETTALPEPAEKEESIILEDAISDITRIALSRTMKLEDYTNMMRNAYLEEVFHATQETKDAARLLDISRPYCSKIMNQFGLKRPRSKNK